jgi:DNA-binding transcriptional LysR family regulator
LDRFEELNAFVAVVEAGSISAAADRLDLAKSGVSRRLADLETRLGTQLVRRTSRRMDLTDAGRGFYDRALRLLDDLEDAEQTARAAEGGLSGRLRVAAPLTFGLGHLNPAVHDFCEQHPDLSVELHLDDAQVDLIAAGCDVGVRIARLADSSLAARRLTHVRHCVSAAPRYLERHGTPEIPADLARHRCLLYANAPDTTWRYRDPSGAEGAVAVDGPLTVNNGEALTAAAVAGLGIVMQPTFIVWRELAAGRLVRILDDHDWPRLDAWAIWPSTRLLSRRVRAFVDFLVERFGGEPYWDAPGAGDGYHRRSSDPGTPS